MIKAGGFRELRCMWAGEVSRGRRNSTECRRLSGIHTNMEERGGGALVGGCTARGRVGAGCGGQRAVGPSWGAGLALGGGCARGSGVLKSQDKENGRGDHGVFLLEERLLKQFYPTLFRYIYKH